MHTPTPGSKSSYPLCLESPQSYGLVVTFFELPTARQHLLEVGRAGTEDEAVSADDRRPLAVGVMISFLVTFIDSTHAVLPITSAVSIFFRIPLCISGVQNTIQNLVAV